MLVCWNVNSWQSVTHQIHKHWSSTNNYDSTVLRNPFVIPHNTYKATPQNFIYILIQRLMQSKSELCFINPPIKPSLPLHLD